MHKILNFWNPNRSRSDALTGWHAKFAGVAVVVALVLLVTTPWSPRHSSDAHANAPRAEPGNYSFEPDNSRLPLHHWTPDNTPVEHIQAF